jgi:serine phosphatase RsbU (regulator of sigma subunit)/anti-sigma regulatory factor (Ser/Thr protein kinase)
MMSSETPVNDVRATPSGLLAPAIWLSNQLSFSRKYLLIGVVVLLALASLSVPLWRKVQHDHQVAELERAGLREFVASTKMLAALVKLRDQAVGVEFQPDLKELDQAIGHVAASTRSRDMAAQLSAKWQQIKALDTSANPQLRFAALNGVINSVLSLMQASTQAYRLNVDHELDATFAMLTGRLPQVLDTLGKQQGAVKLNTSDMAPYALGAQVFLTESLPALREGASQLMAFHPDAEALRQSMERLLAGIGQQQDAADKTLDAPQAWGELQALANNNEDLARAFIEDVAQATDQHLIARINGLQRTQWIIGALLVVALSAISYLFAGIYLSTLRSLTRLSKGTDDFCAGRLDTRIHLDTHDELVLVARNFNTVAEEFGHLLDVIREQNESRQRELETQVQARTAELAEKNEQLSRAGQRVQEELLLARDMQRAILPQEFPDEPGWAVHACMFPARELGGDFYDVFILPDGRCGVLVADVSGKGVGAAFFMAVSRTVLLDLAMTGLPPSQVLAQANDLLCQRNPMEMFVTVCYGVFDPADGTLVYASGGHPAPLLRRAAGTVEALPCANDLALAIMSEMDYTDRHAALAPGDTLLLFTDGVTEAFSASSEAYGDQRLNDWFLQSPLDSSAASQVEALVKNVEQFVDGAEASDDLTCLILCRKQGATSMPSPPVELFNKVLLLEHKLPSRLEEIETLSDAVSAALPERSDLAFSANLCLEELITNIILHGLKGQPDRMIHVRMSMSDEWLEIILKDDAPQFDPFVEAPEPDLDLELDDRPIGGLGVHLVKTLMDDARAYYDGSGNLIVLLKTLRQPGAK